MLLDFAKWSAALPLPYQCAILNERHFDFEGAQAFLRATGLVMASHGGKQLEHLGSCYGKQPNRAALSVLLRGQLFGGLRRGIFRQNLVSQA